MSMRRMLGKTDADLGSQKLMVLHGLGGIGKTQLAVRYAYKFSEMYYSTWWINCSTKDSITRSFFDIANTLVSHHAGKLKEFGLAAVCDEYGSLATTKEMPQKIVDCVIRWLERPGNVNWLLVLDNIDDLDIFSESIIPKHNGTIIMTTRRPECLRFGIGLEVQEMEERDAVQLLLKTSGLSQTSNDPGDNTLPVGFICSNEVLL